MSEEKDMILRPLKSCLRLNSEICLRLMQVNEVHAVAWLDMPFLAATLPPPPFEDANSHSQGRQKSSATSRSLQSTSTTATTAESAQRTAGSTASQAKSSRDGRG